MLLYNNVAGTVFFLRHIRLPRQICEFESAKKLCLVASPRLDLVRDAFQMPPGRRSSPAVAQRQHVSAKGYVYRSAHGFRFHGAMGFQYSNASRGGYIGGGFEYAVTNYLNVGIQYTHVDAERHGGPTTPTPGE